MIEVRELTDSNFKVELTCEHKTFGHWKTKVDVYTASVSKVSEDDETITSVKIEAEGNGKATLYALLGIVSQKQSFYKKAADAILDFLNRYENDPNSLSITQYDDYV